MVNEVKIKNERKGKNTQEGFPHDTIYSTNQRFKGFRWGIYTVFSKLLIKVRAIYTDNSLYIK